jgi:hypothetical protein
MVMVKIAPNQKAQVSIFIIAGIVVVALIVLMFLFFPKLQETLFPQTKSPGEFMHDCVYQDVKDNLEIIEKQGGSLDPGHYILYRGEKIEYLCYTREYYKPCIMQQPNLQGHIELELAKNIEDRVNECFNTLVENNKNAGFDTGGSQKGDVIVELSKDELKVLLTHTLMLSKGEVVEAYGGNSGKPIIISIDNNLYQLVNIANSILNWEARYGKAETTTYMNYYPDLKVEKQVQGEGSTIYILTNRNSGERFQFASRSMVFPPGFGLKELL